MEHSQNTKTITSIIIIIVILIIGYILIAKYQGLKPNELSNSNDKSTVLIENTALVDGKLLAPQGFPAGFPIEEGNVLESATAKYPDQGAKQLSVSYLSSKTVAEKYAEYKAYMTKEGYEITEGDSDSAVRTLFGTKVDVNLSVVMSVQDGKTFVQLGYLIKSGQ